MHGEYRQAREYLQLPQTEKIARQELAHECRGQAKRNGRSRAAGDTASALSDDACRSFPATVLEERKKDVAANLLAEEKRFRRKLVVFYLTFGIFFVARPLVSLCLVRSFLVWIFKDLKFVK